jgi:hypothetical protein
MAQPCAPHCAFLLQVLKGTSHCNGFPVGLHINQTWDLSVCNWKLMAVLTCFLGELLCKSHAKTTVMLPQLSAIKLPRNESYHRILEPESLNLRNRHHLLLPDFIDMETEAQKGWSRSHSLGVQLVPTVRTSLVLLLTLAHTTTFNFSSSHIQLALSRNFIVPIPSVHFAILLSSLYSVLPMFLSVALSLKEEDKFKSIHWSPSVRHFDSSEMAKTPTAECGPSSEWQVLDLQSILGKDRGKISSKICSCYK